MIITSYDFQLENDQRFLGAREELLRFNDFTPQERDQLSRDQENIAYSCIGMAEEVQENRMGNEMAAKTTHAIRLMKKEQQSFLPIEARIKEEIKVAEEFTAITSLQSDIDNAEKYCQMMLALEQESSLAAKRVNIKEFEAVIWADFGTTQATLFDIFSIIISAWKTRCNIDEMKALETASQNVKAFTEGVLGSFTLTLLSTTNDAFMKTNSNSLLSTKNNEDERSKPPFIDEIQKAESMLQVVPSKGAGHESLD